MSDIEDFGLCRECARAFNMGHAVGCSRAGKPINPPMRYVTCGERYANVPHEPEPVVTLRDIVIGALLVVAGLIAADHLGFMTWLSLR